MGHKLRVEEWTTLFSEPKSHTCVRENTAFWDTGHGPPPTTSQELLRTFLADQYDDTNPYLYQEDEIEGFCLPAKLSLLEDGNSEQVQKPMALLDDRTEDTQTAIRGTCRTNKGPLSAHMLYNELKKPVG